MSATDGVHLVAALGIGYTVLEMYRFIRRHSTVLGAFVAAGILVRVGLGLGLFWISYLQLPIAESLQAGGGFWELAVDGRNYYTRAARVLEAGSLALDPAAPSPFFIRTLAVWMFVVGVSPAAGMFLNLFLYVALAAAAVRIYAPVNEWRRDLPCIVLVAAYSFSPAILIHSTQPLKDDAFNVLVAMGCLGVLALSRLMHRPPRVRDHWLTVCGTVALATATFGAAGIRGYYGFMIFCALALVLAIFAIRGRTMPLSRYLAGALAVLCAVWVGFWAGSGGFYFIAAGLTTPTELSNITQVARAGFLMSGGATNVVQPLHEDAALGKQRYQELVTAQYSGKTGERTAGEAEHLAGITVVPKVPIEPPPTALPAPTVPSDPSNEIAPVMLAVPVTIVDQAVAVVRGLAIVFVPVSLLKAISEIEVEGGRGLLAVVDLDTIVLDIASVVVLGLLWTRRRAIGDRLPFVVFGLVLACVSAVLLGYVVTNFGTLWRLRSLIAVPLWILVVALSTPSETFKAVPSSKV